MNDNEIPNLAASADQPALNWADWLKRFDINAIDEVVTYILERGKPESDEARWYRDDVVAELLSERNPEGKAYGSPHILASEIVRLVRPTDARGLATEIVWSHVQDQIRQFEEYA